MRSAAPSTYRATERNGLRTRSRAYARAASSRIASIPPAPTTARSSAAAPASGLPSGRVASLHVAGDVRPVAQGSHVALGERAPRLGRDEGRRSLDLVGREALEPPLDRGGQAGTGVQRSRGPDRTFESLPITGRPQVLDGTVEVARGFVPGRRLRRAARARARARAGELRAQGLAHELVHPERRVSTIDRDQQLQRVRRLAEQPCRVVASPGSHHTRAPRGRRVSKHEGGTVAPAVG